MVLDNPAEQDFLEMWRASDGEWNDESETAYRPYIMEFEGTLDPLNPDCDGDGLSDGDEVENGMNPLLADSDGDGLTDAAEAAVGLHGGLKDSDADGLADPDELLAGTDPLNPDSDGDGLYDGEEITITLTDPLSPSGSAPDADRILSMAGSASHGRLLVDNNTAYHECANDQIMRPIFA